MLSGARSSVVLGFTLLACFGPDARVSRAQQPQLRIESVFPQQLARGQSSVINVAIQSREVVQGAEIAPAQGVTVSRITQARQAEISQGIAWWEITVDVARDAAPGSRSLVLVLPTGRTLPIAVTVPTHVPGISDLRIVSAQATQPVVELQFAATDTSADLGDAPYVWFTTGCGGEPLAGVVRGKVRAGVVHAAVPNPRKAAGGAPPGGCDLQVRMSDSSGFDSNSLKTTVDFKN